MMTKLSILDAVVALVPGAQVTNREGVLEWIDPPVPPVSDEQIAAKYAELVYLEEVKEYQRQRAAEYPSLQAQQDMQYWDAVNGTTTWVDTIAAVKAKYPKAEPDQTEIDSRKATAVFDLQLAKYKNAVARLAQIELSKGGTVTRVEKTLIGQSVDPVTFEMSDIFDEQVLETVVPAVEDVEHEVVVSNEDGTKSIQQVRNPLIVKDEEERAAAQAIVDATPEEVKAAA